MRAEEYLRGSEQSRSHVITICEARSYLMAGFHAVEGCQYLIA